MKISEMIIRRFFSKNFSVHSKTRQCYINELSKLAFIPEGGFLIRKDDGILEIVLNRPEKMNALGKQLVSEFLQCIDQSEGKR